MKTYYRGSSVVCDFEIRTDENASVGDIVVKYRVRVFDDKDTLLVEHNYEPAGGVEPLLSITVEPEFNDLAEDEATAFRAVELVVELEDGTYRQYWDEYMIVGGQELIVGVNSFLTYGGAQKLSYEMPLIDNWNESTKEERVKALHEAYNRICLLSFYVVEKWDYKHAAFPKAAFNLNSISKEEYLGLSSKFRKALEMAQLAEADDVLNVDSIDERRRRGLILETIGESKQMFASGKALTFPVSSRALRYLGKYLITSKRTGRTS